MRGHCQPGVCATGSLGCSTSPVLHVCRAGKDSRGRVFAGRSGFMKPHVHTRQAEGGWGPRARFRRTRDTMTVRNGSSFENDWEEVCATLLHQTGQFSV